MQTQISESHVALLVKDSITDHSSLVEWIGVTITALAGLAGVVFTARNANKKDIARLAFDEEQARRAIDHAKREVIRGNMSAMVDRFADVEQSTWPRPYDEYEVPFDDGFYEDGYWDDLQRKFRREVALIHDSTTRSALGTVVDAISGAYWLVRERAMYESLPKAVRELAELGAEIGAAWLRGETIASAELEKTDLLKDELDTIYAELEERQSVERSKEVKND